MGREEHWKNLLMHANFKDRHCETHNQGRAQGHKAESRVPQDSEINEVAYFYCLLNHVL